MRPHAFIASNGDRVSTSEQMEQYTSLEFILLGDLRDLLEEPVDKYTHRWLRAVLDVLLDTLPRQWELREEGGYFADVLRHHPYWYTEVDELRRRQHKLYDKLRHLRARLMERVPYAEISGDLSRELRDWMQSLLAFHRHERRMVQTGFNLEVGVGD